MHCAPSVPVESSDCLGQFVQTSGQILQLGFLQGVQWLVCDHVLVDVRNVVDGLLRVVLQCVLHADEGLVGGIELFLNSRLLNDWSLYLPQGTLEIS